MIAPASNVPPAVDSVHGRNCNCHHCAPVAAPVWIKRGATLGIATIFNQDRRPMH